jgi:hypothetical protein
MKKFIEWILKLLGKKDKPNPLPIPIPTPDPKPEEKLVDDVDISKAVYHSGPNISAWKIVAGIRRAWVDSLFRWEWMLPPGQPNWKQWKGSYGNIWIGWYEGDQLHLCPIDWLPKGKCDTSKAKQDIKRGVEPYEKIQEGEKFVFGISTCCRNGVHGFGEERTNFRQYTFPPKRV